MRRRLAAAPRAARRPAPTTAAEAGRVCHPRLVDTNFETNAAGFVIADNELWADIERGHWVLDPDPQDVSVFAGEGNDAIWGGAGSQVHDGGEGNDAIWAGPGGSLVFGGEGNDMIHGGVGDHQDVWGARDGEGRSAISWLCDASPEANQTGRENRPVHGRCRSGHPRHPDGLLLGSHRRIGRGLPPAPLLHGGGADAVARCQRPHALLAPLYRATHCLSRGGAAVENLAHSSSLAAPRLNVPSHSGTEHLVTYSVPQSPYYYGEQRQCGKPQ